MIFSQQARLTFRGPPKRPFDWYWFLIKEGDIMTTTSRRLAKLFLAAFLLIVGPSPLLATWSPTGNPVCTAAGTQELSDMISTGGGAAMVWVDYRNGNWDIYAQRLTIPGDPTWGTDGIALCTNAAYQLYPKIVYEGPAPLKGLNYAAVWDDSRSGNHDIYAQCFNLAGTLAYPTDGTPIASGVGDQEYPDLASGGVGTNYVVWTDRQTTTQDIYAQAFNRTNSALWGAGGLPICTATGVQSGALVVADGTAGAIFVWSDQRAGVGIYAQKVNAAGTVLWPANGVPVRTGPPYTDYGPAQIVSDGAGGAIILWYEQKAGLEYDLYAQRLDASGNQMWGTSGKPVCTAAGSRGIGTADMIPDGSEGAFVIWNDSRNPQQPDVYAQRISGMGSLYWNPDGVPVCTAAYPQNSPHLAADGFGGVVVTWTDLRDMGPPDIYAQRLDGAGTPQWATDGIPLFTNPYMQIFPQIVNDTRGGSIVAWKDARNGNDDLYAMRIENELGYPGYPTPTIISVTDVPGDNGGFVTMDWWPGDGAFDFFDIYRAILPAAVSARGGESQETTKGVTFPDRAGCQNGYTWQYMSTVPWTGAPTYSAIVPTAADSSGADISTWFTYFMVIAYTTGVGDPFTSCPGFGYSVDNLAPPAPQLWAQRNGGPVDLTFTRTAPDILVFAIYRSDTPGTPISLGTLLTSTPNTTYHDASAPPGPLYYQVAALDIHANLSEPSNEASVDAPTGIDSTPRIASFTLGGNLPNPFSTVTTLRVASPGAREAVLDVFDAAGRRVRSSRLALQEGWQNVSFDGSDDNGRPLASGVYFYRISSGPEVRTSKMVIYR